MHRDESLVFGAFLSKTGKSIVFLLSLFKETTIYAFCLIFIKVLLDIIECKKIPGHIEITGEKTNQWRS
ncbi:hypothetical protein DDZ16_08945 [Marinilabilia rubra]|uniref:Uncharacterized protein n=1 Tax=Marinilabilia rubra TaxID=2162893 RepID=A0A2U2B913_9BACT|nr:hypothetical protein DDZ16_08945 [Marinilabilia rubra]